MMRRTIQRGLCALAVTLLSIGSALASNCSSNPFTLANGQVADATQVMANFNNLLNCANNNLAHNGANSDITSLSALTTPLSVAQGGTGTATLTLNNVMLGNGVGAIQFVAPSTNGNWLTSNGTTFVSTNTVANPHTFNGNLIANSTLNANAALNNVETTLASASTVDIGAAAANTAIITGASTITSLGSPTQAGIIRNVVFASSGLILTNNSVIILPGGANITTAAGDTAFFVSEAPNVWRAFGYTKASGQPIVQASGSPVQIVMAESGGVATGTTVLPADDTIPQNTEGDQYMTITMTPQNSSSTLIIDMTAMLTNAGGSAQTMALFRDAGANAIAAMECDPVAGSFVLSCVLQHKAAAGSTVPTTFTMRSGNNAGSTTTFNGVGGVRRFGGVAASSIIVTETLP